MEIILDKSELVRELAITQGVVEKKSTVPILSNFLLEATENNNLLITATDLDLSLRTFCPAKIKKQGSCTIPARKLYDYVRLLRDGEITIKSLENDWVQIRCGRSNTKMVGLSRKNFPSLPLYPAQSAIQLPAAVLRTMISRTIFAVSQEGSRYTLNGALLVLQPGTITMVATDGHRLALVQAAKTIAAVTSEMKVLVSRKALVELNSLLSVGGIETFEFAKDENTLFFRIGARLLTCRQLAGTFPNYEAVLPRDYTPSLSVPCGEFSQAIQRVSQFSDERSNTIRVKAESNQVQLSSSSVDTGESEEILETTYAGDPMKTGFNARYLIDFLRVTGTDKVSFHFKEPSAAAEFRPDEGSASEYKYRYVVMPMRT
jgi:DNA polymerase III subunit beta